MMQKISDARNDHDEWWGSHFAYEGDLVGMSYLYYVKDFHKPRQRVFAPRNCNNGKAVNLSLIHILHIYRWQVYSAIWQLAKIRRLMRLLPISMSSLNK